MELYAAPTVGGTSDVRAHLVSRQQRVQSLSPLSHLSLDGNCLFRALSDQLYGSPQHYVQLREEVSRLFPAGSIPSPSDADSQVCDFIAQHRERFAPFLDEDEGLEAHLESMRLQGPSHSLTESLIGADGDYGCRDMGNVH